MKKTKYNLIYENISFAKKSKFDIWKFAPDILIILIFLCYVAFSLIFLTTYSYYLVQHTSMQPLLNNYTLEELSSGVCDGVYVNLHAKGNISDIIVVRNDIDETAETVIKRLIAVGGDKIAITKTLLENDEYTFDILRIPKGNSAYYIMQENYIDETHKNIGMNSVYENFQNLLVGENWQIINGEKFLVLAEDEIFYLGDNRGNSRDCAEYGPINASNIIGRVDIIVPRQQNIMFHIIEYVLGFKKI